MIYPNKHRGTIVPMVTPFTEDLALDVKGAERMVDRLARNGLGVFVLGTTGEAASIPVAMRNQLVEIASKIAAGRVPVYAGICDNCVLASIESAKEFLRLGADAVVAPLPSYYVLDAGEMLEYFELLSAQVDGPLVAYNIPQATRMSIPVDVVARIADLENVVAFKDSENQPGRLEAVARLGNRPDFSIFMGVARLSLTALKAGYDGLVPSSGNIAPELWNAFTERFALGDIDTVAELQCRLDRLAQVFQANRTLGQSLASLKSCMSALGLCQNIVLPPLRTDSDDAVEACRAQLEAFDLALAPTKSEN